MDAGMMEGLHSRQALRTPAGARVWLGCAEGLAWMQHAGPPWRWQAEAEKGMKPKSACAR